MAVDKAIISHIWSTSILAQYYIPQLRKLLKVQSVPLSAFPTLIPSLCHDFIRIPRHTHQFQIPLSAVLSFLFISRSKMHLSFPCVSRGKLKRKLQRRRHRWRVQREWFIEEKVAARDKKKKKNSSSICSNSVIWGSQGWTTASHTMSPSGSVCATSKTLTLIYAWALSGCRRAHMPRL